MTLQGLLDRKANLPANARDRSIIFADIAQEIMQLLGQSRIPRNYEIWYVYASGANSALNKAIDEKLAAGALGEADLQQLYDANFSMGRSFEEFDKVSASIGVELGSVMELLSGALRAHTIYDRELVGATAGLTKNGGAAAIESVVAALVRSTRRMHEESAELKARLDSSIQEIASLQQGLEIIRLESRTDALTGLSNRKHFDEVMNRSIGSALAQDEPLSLLLVDIDHFKSFNDNYGHLTGDHVLRLVARSVRHNVNGQDITARYGGEEFAVVLPGTSLRQAITVAEHIRNAVMSKELKKKSTGEILGRITVSVGVATFSKFDSKDTLIERADDCLYAAKRGGRNRVVAQSDHESPRDRAIKSA